MRAVLTLVAIVIIGLIAAVQLDWIRIDQTRSAQLPEFKADTADISIGTVNKTIEVPKVEVTKPGEPEKTQ